MKIYRWSVKCAECKEVIDLEELARQIQGNEECRRWMIAQLGEQVPTWKGRPLSEISDEDLEEAKGWVWRNPSDFGKNWIALSEELRRRASSSASWR